MSHAAACSYDELPYEDFAFYHTHPSNLAVVATLCGLEPPALEGCRVLELGCGSGFNLLAMTQSLPKARCVGIDLSVRQIEQGRATAALVGADRLELHARGLADLDAALGAFDYVVVHGLFSWVPAEVREATLAICKRHLAPGGIAYISYNTYPGWHLRTVLRDILLFHAPAEAPPVERTQRARAALERLLADLPDSEADYGRLLRAEVESLRGDSDTYVFHEFLEAHNLPLRFEEFARMASAHGLRFLAEARFGTNSFAQGEQLQTVLAAVSDDLIRREQHHDYLRNRSFRQSLLCHADVRPSWSPSAQAVGRLYILGRVEPLGVTAGKAGDTSERFRVEGRQAPLDTADPVLPQVLHCLHEAWPRPVPVEDLATKVFERLGSDHDLIGLRPGLVLAPLIVRGYAGGLWHLFAYPPPFRSATGECPRAGALARHLADKGGAVINLLHRSVQLTEAERAVLRRLDGQTPREQLLTTLGMSPGALDKTLQVLAEAALLSG